MTEEPKVLYRYRHLQGDYREWTKQIIVNSKLHFASPLKFNDPFDCKVLFQPSLSSKKLRRKLSISLKKKDLGLNRSERRRIIAQRNNPKKFVGFMRNMMQDKVNKVGILSLSEVNDNILMWSHYAFGHTGLCIGFSSTNVSPFFGFAQRVHYTSNYPDIDVLGSIDEMVEAFLLTKANDWEYEAEWRIIDHDEGPGERPFPEELMTEIIFGARMSEEDKREVIGWLEKRSNPISVLQAVLETKTYSLRIEPYAF